jgi:hypothetical protein
MTTNTDQKLDAILAAIQSLEARVTHIETKKADAGGARNTASTSLAKKLSIREFLLEKPPSTDIQRTLAVGYFLETHVGLAAFTKADLEKGYDDAKEPRPSNIGVNIRHSIKQGHMMEAADKKANKTAYVVTRSGEQFVADGYKKTPRASSR